MSQGIIICLKNDLFIVLVILGQNEKIVSKIMWNYKISSFVELLHAQAIRMQSVI
jgi:hypothetical protein